MTIKYLVVLTTVLAIVSVGLFMAWLMAKDEIEDLESDLSKLRRQHRKLKDESLEKSIQEKASVWRRDRRFGDTRHGGYFVEDENTIRQPNGGNEMK